MVLHEQKWGSLRCWVTCTLQDKAKDFQELYASIVQNTDDPAKVPTIIDAGAELTESLVVVEYLDQKYGGAAPLLPQDPLQRAKVGSQLHLSFNFTAGSMHACLWRMHACHALLQTSCTASRPERRIFGTASRPGGKLAGNACMQSG